MFIDRANINIKSGKGGDGSVSFRREKYVPDGGPDGGDGGNGGDIVFVADNNMRTLMDFRYQTKYKAADGEDGKKKKQFGKNSEPLVIKVPVGTTIIDEETGLIMADMIEDGQRFVAARGGKGGKGNVHFKSSTRQAPNFAEAGGFAQERNVILELKLLGDVGLVGFPNVGKSTLLSVITSAKPKIGNYPFTTLTPNLGVVYIHDTSFVVSDIPGLIEGAHEGLGLGLDFLKHIERNKILLHVVDVAGSEGRDPIEDFDKINNELSKYSDKLIKKPQIVAANKMDVADPEIFRLFKEHVENKGYKVFPISAATHQGIDELLNYIANELPKIKEEPEPMDLFFDEEIHGNDQSYREIFANREDGIYVLSGKQLEKIFNSTNFNDLESLRYLDNYLKKRGAYDKLKELGIKEGDTVKIKNYEFDYYE
ncbi:MAG: GTPase ObgE [Peptostreptococcales bacterium]